MPPIVSESAPLPDRNALLAALDKAAAGGRRFALLVVNLDRFRDINIEFGHAFGDQLLGQVVQRMRSALRAHDALFHVGADEFAIVLGDLKSPHLAELAARKMLELVSCSFEVQGSAVALSARAGAALFPEHADAPAELMQCADAAQRNARDRLQGYTIYDPLKSTAGREWTDLKRRLRAALDSRDLLLYYQPQVDLQQGVIAGCEALVRWRDAERGWISPELFVPVAESSDLIETLTYWSVNVALREWFGQRDGCCAQASVSVNLSARLLHSPEVVELIRRAMSIWGAVPRELVLEVTESAMMSDPRLARRTLEALADLGVTLSIDDFGTGYSSLAYLKDLPVSELKIDKSFVQHMVERRQDCKIVQSAIDLAHNLDLRVVAEGIENRQTLDTLTTMGCDVGQGYHISRPMPLEDLSSWIRAGGRWCAPPELA